MGRTKVFLRAGQIGILDSKRAEVLDAAAKRIQHRLQTFIAHRNFVSIRSAAFVFQAYCRGFYFSNINFYNLFYFIFIYLVDSNFVSFCFLELIILKICLGWFK